MSGAVHEERAVVIPPMPSESFALAELNSACLQRARLAGDDLVFEEEDGASRALEDGFFLLEIPAAVSVTALDEFCKGFYRSIGDGPSELRDYRGFRDIEFPGGYQGYFDRDHDQWENFYIEQRNWSLLPTAVNAQGDELVTTGVRVLRAVLRALSVPEEHWDRVTGGLTKGAGHRMLAFNHFRSDKRLRGCKFHRDSGWVTVLRSTEPGLIAIIGNEIRAIWPQDGYFIINFGSSIEVLTGALRNPVRASVHGVVQTERELGVPDRHSYVAFLDSDLSADIYRLDGTEPAYVESVADFAEREVSRTYDDDNSNL
jgi:hypothetical protein